MSQSTAPPKETVPLTDNKIFASQSLNLKPTLSNTKLNYARHSQNLVSATTDKNVGSPMESTNSSQFPANTNFTKTENAKVSGKTVSAHMVSDVSSVISKPIGLRILFWLHKLP